jgi:P4 family phage/plasmid primase-like protien
MRIWYGDRNGLGVVLGKVSGHVEMFEIEGAALAAGELETLIERLEASGLAEAFAEIRAGYEERTPGGGRHWLVCTEKAIPSTKLARDPDNDVKWEVKGEGGFTILAPSNGSVHPNGGAYELLAGGFAHITAVPRKVLNQIYAVIATLDEKPQRLERPTSSTAVKGDRPGDRYNADPAAQRLTRELLEGHGWTHTHSIGTTDYLLRPGKHHGGGDHSATLGYYQDPPMLLVFSTSTKFATVEERGYTPFEVFTELEHGGDHSAAARALAANGYGDPATISIVGAPAKTFSADLRYTDTDNAERLMHLYADRLRYVMAWRSWLVWTGKVWQRDPDAVLVHELAKDVSRHLYLEIAADPSAASKDLISWAKASAGVAKIRAIEILARGMDGVIIDHEELDADPWAFGVANGWFNLRDGTFHPPNPAKLMTMATSVTFDPNATAPRWEQALTEWLPDPEVRRYLQRLCGEAIVGTVRDHLLVLLVGDGGNGKGTFIDTLAKALGPYFIVPHKSLLTLTRSDTHSTEKAALFRRRLAVAAETEGSVRLAEASVKELTGGDRLGARRLYENPWWFDPTHSLWMQTNHLPEIAGTDEGIWRRVRVMRWPEYFTGEREDSALREKLADELPGILNWIIEGAIAWQAEGLSEPAAITEASAAYRQEQDQLSRFLEAMEYRLGDQLWCPAKQLQQDWATWTEAELGRRLAGQALAQRLHALGLRKDARRPPSWHGIGKDADRP